MATLDTRPELVDVTGYAGDTLTITIQAPAAVTDGKTWLAQIKSSRSSDIIDAEWEITPPAASGGIAVLVLDAATTAALVSGTGSLATRRTTSAGTFAAGTQYKGEWDCEVSDANSTRTLVQGTLTIDQDVTRL